MAAHSSILGWRIPWTEEPGGHKESNVTEGLSTYIRQVTNKTYCIAQGTPLTIS